MLLNEIKNKSLEARKAKNEIRASLLVTLYSEAQMVGKSNGNRESTDEEVTRIVKKFVKNCDDTISVLTAQAPSDPRLAIAIQEKSILEEFLPKQLSETELFEAIKVIVSQLPERNPKQMGLVMKQLKDKYGSNYDGSSASKLVKEALL